jgi:nicotinate-nucleotide pyrophosphorylase (carboxylating)
VITPPHELLASRAATPLLAEIVAQYGPLLADTIERNASAMLEEDVGPGDLSAALLSESKAYTARIISREPAVLCGVLWFEAVMRRVDAAIEVTWHLQEGEQMAPDAVFVSMKGPARALLTAERSSMNFLQMLSGVATTTRRFVERVAGTGARIVDTRKTIPGLRLAQKYAVRVGGGVNHRLGLYDGILLKENHLIALGGVGPATDLTHTERGSRFVQIEVENLDQLAIALQHGADSLLLDNFTLEAMREAVRLTEGRASLEVSGNVNLETVRAIAETGVDRISIGALTKDVRAVDLSMRFH